MIIIFRTIFKVAILTGIWFIFRETFSFPEMLIAVAISSVCVWYSHKFIPLNSIKGINFFKLILFFFQLIGQIYISGFTVIKMILTGATAYVVSVKTSLQNETLRIILGDSITLTPGSVLLDVTGDDIKVVLLCNKNDPEPLKDVDKKVKGNLEKHLAKVGGEA